MNEMLTKFREFFKNDGQDYTKRKIQNLIIFVILGIFFMLVGGVFSGDKPNQVVDNELNANELIPINQFKQYDQDLQQKIIGILSKIEGVGSVDIAITYQAGEEIVPAQDTRMNESNTKEQDREGGVRSTIQTDTDSKIIVGSQSEISPVILKVIPPQVKGVIVVAKGAKNEITKIDISRAVSTLVGISLSKVEVFAMSN